MTASSTVLPRSRPAPVQGSGFGARMAEQNLFLLLLMLAAFALRVYHLDAMSFWSDEGISVIRARTDFATLLAALPLEHMPLYFAGLHLWMQITGEGDFAVRFFSLLFSVLTVPLVYDLGAVVETHQITRAHSRQNGLSILGILSAALVVINPLQIWYAQEARMYSLVVALCAGAAWALMRAYGTHVAAHIDGTPQNTVEKKYWLAFALCGAAALYTHFFAALTLFALGVWAMLAAQKIPSLWRPFIGATALIGVLFLPWVPRAIAALGFPGWQPAADLATLPDRYLVAYTLGTTVAEPWTWLAVGFLVLLLLGAWVLSRQGLSGGLILAGVFVPFLVMMLIALRKPGYQERYLIIVTPFLFVVLGAAIKPLLVPTRPLWHWQYLPFAAAVTFVGFTMLLSLSNLYFDPSFAKPDYRSAAQYVDSLSRNGDGLIFDGPDPYKAFYRYFSRRRVVAFDANDFDSEDTAESTAFLERQVPLRDRWWVVLYFHEPGPTEDWLAHNGYQTSSRWFNGIRVLLYATPTDASLRTVDVNVQTTLPLRIASVRLLPIVHAGDILPIILRWQPTGVLAADYQASLRLLDANGNRVRQLDRRPLDGRVLTSHWKPGETIEDRYGLLVPEGTVLGAYTVQVILYPLNGSEALNAQINSVQVVGDAAR